jgi:hypothetical protein
MPIGQSGNKGDCRAVGDGQLPLVGCGELSGP